MGSHGTASFPTTSLPGPPLILLEVTVVLMLLLPLLQPKSMIVVSEHGGSAVRPETKAALKHQHSVREVLMTARKELTPVKAKLRCVGEELPVCVYNRGIKPHS